MDCQYCKHDNPGGARFCNWCGRRIGDHLDGGRKCVSCGRHMDYDVFFNLCPHCGFAYRMGVSQSDGACADAAYTRMLLYYISLLVPLAGIVVGGAYLRETLASRKLARSCILLSALNLGAVSVAILLLNWTSWF